VDTKEVTYSIIDERIPVNGRESAVWPNGDDENDRQQQR
jgi:hypothetical protein